MTFDGMSLRQVYRSSTHRIGRDFLGALLDGSKSYDRAAAFFSSTVFTVALEPFVAFFRRGGRMRLVCSPVLDAEDIRALGRGIFDAPRVLREFGTLEEVARGGVTPDLLSLLLASRAMDVRIAIPTGTGRAIYHEKIGVLTDSDGATVAFSGSPNESRTAWSQNFERVDAFASWIEGQDRVRASGIVRSFVELWRNETDRVVVYELADAFRRRLLQPQEAHASAADTPKTSSRPPATVVPEVLRQPSDIELRPHQEKAIRAWVEAGGRGLLEMATGSGKTIAALALAAHLGRRIPNGLVVLIVAPFIHLVDQWCEVGRKFGLQPVRCAEGRARWLDDLRWAINAVNAGARPVLSIATTDATLGTGAFQDLMARISAPVLIIADEAHNYGAPSTLAALPQNARFRLGLSATPDRWMDDEGTAALIEYFGPVVFRYGLAEAIRDEVLTPYRYYPIRISLEPDELDEYIDISRQLARYLVIDDDRDGPAGEVAMRLLLKRARLLGAARGKIPALKALLSERRSDTHMLVYCGDGRVDGPEPGETVRQVAEAVRVIGRDLGMRCASYTAATPPDRRLELLRSFEAGDLQTLVAIRCLDEGVDVPATRTAFILASSTNPRQFIQRRGRVLRRSPGKARAYIYDFIVTPDIGDVPIASPEYNVIRRLLRNELRRAGEFAALAENGPIARQQLLDITSHFQLFTAIDQTQRTVQE